MPALNLSPEEKAQVERYRGLIERFERAIGDTFRARCDHFYREYRGFKRAQYEWVKAGPRDRDGLVAEARDTWGAKVHVPVAFDTIETMAPYLVAHRPRMLVLPRDPMAEPNVLAMRALIDAQQSRIDYDLKLQDVLKDGLIYGLGAGKVMWRREWIEDRRARRTLRSWLTGEAVFQPGPLKRRLRFDDPDFLPVDPYDLAWHELGDSPETCDWMADRSWLSLQACIERIRDGVWNTPAAQRLTEEDLRGLGSGQKWDETWQERMAAAGFSTSQTRAEFTDGTRGEQIHEAWEIHTRTRTVVLLDREVVVADSESQCPGYLPYPVWRPTRQSRQMVGIGEVEPIEHLARELDILRSQRRDAATLALCAGYAFDSSAVDEDDLVFGPGAAIEVRGDPRAALMPLNVKEVPGSSYQEEQAIWANIQRVSGLNDALMGGDGGGISTATEAELVRASLSKRIEFKARRFEAEVIRPSARLFLALNQRCILSERVEREMLPPDPENPNVQRWRWFKVDPGSLMGEMEIEPEGGSTQARNIPLEMQRAQALMAFRGDPNVDQRLLYHEVLRLMQIDRPEAWMTKGQQPVPPKALEVLEQMGVAKELIEFAVQQAQASDPRIPDPLPTREEEMKTV